MDVVAWALSRCLKGLRVVSWSTLGCSNELQPPSRAFLSQLGKRPASACFWGNHFCKGFPLLFLSPVHQWLCCACSGGAVCRAISDGTRWAFGHQQGFSTLCTDKSFCVSYNLQGRLSRGRWLSADPTDNTSVPMRCSRCPGSRGAVRGSDSRKDPWGCVPSLGHLARFHRV